MEAMSTASQNRALSVRDALYEKYPAADGWAIGVHSSGATQVLTAAREGRVTTFATGVTRRTVPGLVSIFAKAIDDMETTAPSSEEAGPLAPRASALNAVAEDGKVHVTVGPDGELVLDAAWTPAEALDFAERVTRAARIALKD